MKFQKKILAADADIDSIESWLGSLDGAARIQETRSLNPKAQRRLWKLARGRAVTLEQLVPSNYGPLDPVRHFGRNTLPALRNFEKRMCRPDDGSDTLWGYNEGVTRRVVGPGYYVVRATPDDSRGAVVVDYYQVPPTKPASWPTIVPNERGVQQFVYARMHDFLRRVSDHVTIGRAYKNDRETPNCFVLCRE